MTAHARRLPGEAGIWVLVFLDITVFGSLFVNCALARLDAGAAWSAALSPFDRSLGCVNTIVLLTSSWLVALAVTDIRHARPARARGLIIAALALALLFIAIKIFEYAEKLGHGITPTTSSYFNFFYSLTGLHLFHVVVGAGVLLWTRGRMTAGAGEPQLRHIECGAIFWHMVDLLWIVIFPLLYLM